MKICYEHRNFSTERMLIISMANEIIEEYGEQGYDLTLRQLYYQFIARDLFPDDGWWVYKDPVTRKSKRAKPGRVTIQARRLISKFIAAPANLISSLALLRERLRTYLWRQWKKVRNRFKELRHSGVPLLNHNCRWCKDEVLKRAEPRWLEYPLLIIGIRPYYCPHCYMQSYRFK